MLYESCCRIYFIMKAQMNCGVKCMIILCHCWAHKTHIHYFQKSITSFFVRFRWEIFASINLSCCCCCCFLLILFILFQAFLLLLKTIMKLKLFPFCSVFASSSLFYSFCKSIVESSWKASVLFPMPFPVPFHYTLLYILSMGFFCFKSTNTGCEIKQDLWFHFIIHSKHIHKRTSFHVVLLCCI